MRIDNKKARFDYNLYDQLEAGVVLTGAEVKAVKRGAVDLTHAHAKFVGGELFLVGAAIATDKGEGVQVSRKLLLHREEIISLLSKTKQKKLTIMPLGLYTKGRILKVRIALAKRKRKYEKRDALRKKDERKAAI